MKKNTTTHILHFFVLALLLVLSASCILYFGSDRLIQSLVVILTSLGYVMWGYMHHKVEHTLQAKVLLEYVLISLLCASILLSIIFRA